MIEWIDNNNMIANPGKFKAIVLSKNNIGTVGTKFHIREKAIYSSDKVDLLGIAIDDQLNFESHISEICRKAAGQLNTLKRLGSYIPLESRKILANSFILSNFNYCHFGISQQQNRLKKLKKFRKGFSNLFTMIMKLTIHHY